MEGLRKTTITTSQKRRSLGRDYESCIVDGRSRVSEKQTHLKLFSATKDTRSDGRQSQEWRQNKSSEWTVMGYHDDDDEQSTVL
jgi:hypothetical protein